MEITYSTEVLQMGVAHELEAISQSISAKVAEINEKIQRLETAKKDILEEKTISMNELKLVTNPELGESWTGERATKFDKDRSSAKKELNRILTDDYEEYITSIDNQISLLEFERSALNKLSFLANETSVLAEKGSAMMDKIQHEGQEAVESVRNQGEKLMSEVASKISFIKGSL